MSLRPGRFVLTKGSEGHSPLAFKQILWMFFFLNYNKNMNQKIPIKDFIIYLSIFLVIFLYTLVFRNIADPTFGDEAMLLYGAKRILMGQQIYRDFGALVLPGVYYCLVILFKIFGTKIVVARIFNGVLVSFICVLVFLLSKKLTQNKFIAILPSCILVFCYPILYIVSYYWFDTFFSLLGIYFLTRFLEAPSKKFNVFFAAIMFILEAICFHYKGFLIIFFVYLYLGFLEKFWADSSRAFAIRRARLIFLMVIVITILPLFLFFTIKRPEAFEFIVLVPLQKYLPKFTSPSYYFFGNNIIINYYKEFINILGNLSLNNLPVQSLLIFMITNALILNIIIGYIHFLVYPIGILICLLHKQKDPRYLILLLYLFCSMPLFFSDWFRNADRYILIFDLPIAVIILSFLLLYLKDYIRKFICIYLYLITSTYLILITNNIHKNFVYPVEWNRWGTVYYSDGDIANRYSALISFVNNNIGKDEKIFVYMYGTSLYTMFDRDNIAKLDVAIPGMELESWKYELLNSLENNMPVFIFYDYFPEKVKVVNPNIAKMIPSQHPWSEFIRKYYTSYKFYDKINVMVFKRK